MKTVKDIAAAIEAFAPKWLQEDYDNTGLQVGRPDLPVSAVLICLDVTEEIVEEAARRGCNLIVSHHPLIFKGLKQLTGANVTQRIVMQALRRDIAVYSAHTNLDSVVEGVSWEMAGALSLHNLTPLDPNARLEGAGIGLIGEVTPTPTLEFLRKVKDVFKVRQLRYSAQSPQLVVRRVAVCGGSGASLIGNALRAGADLYLTGDIKYHDYTSYGKEIVLADVGHYESEIGSREIFARLLRQVDPEMPVYFAETDTNPIKYL